MIDAETIFAEAATKANNGIHHVPLDHPAWDALCLICREVSDKTGHPLDPSEFVTACINAAMNDIYYDNEVAVSLFILKGCSTMTRKELKGLLPEVIKALKHPKLREDGPTNPNEYDYW